MFKSALLKLTIWYASIAVILSLLLSVFLYHFATVELREGLHNQYTAIISKDQDGDAGADFSSQEFQERAGQLYIELIYFNVIVLLAATGGSYLLARRTLKPIQLAHEAQVRFTAHASHELRTPLAAIRADTESVLLTKSDDARLFKKTLKANLSDIIRMEVLTDHLLSVARFRSAPSEKEDINLYDLVLKAIKEIKRTNRESKINLDAKQKNISVRGDAVAIKQAVLTLLDNALKYGGSKPIEVDLDISGKQAIIKVVDYGRGIDEKDLPYIFEPFYRSKTLQDNNSGFGLGLALAKEIIESSNGSIAARNSDNGGAIFSIRLPII